MPLYLTDEQILLRDTAQRLRRRARAGQPHARAARRQRRHRLLARPVEAVRRDGLHRHPHPRGRWRPRPRPCRGGRGARGDRPQPLALPLPHHRRRRGRSAQGHRRTPRAGSPASSPARPSPRWRSTSAPSMRQDRDEGRARRATASASPAPSSSSRTAMSPTCSSSLRAPPAADATASRCSRSTHDAKGLTADPRAPRRRQHRRARSTSTASKSMPTR